MNIPIESGPAERPLPLELQQFATDYKLDGEAMGQLQQIIRAPKESVLKHFAGVFSPSWGSLDLIRKNLEATARALPADDTATQELFAAVIAFSKNHDVYACFSLIETLGKTSW